MKRFFVGLGAGAVAVLLLALVAGAIAQTNVVEVDLSPGERARISCIGGDMLPMLPVSATQVLVGCEGEVEPPPEPTPTPLPPEPTPTPEPTPPPVSSTLPLRDAPLCEEHDDRAFHTIWNAEDGCHYDHAHGQDPHLVDDIFGTDVYDWMGGEISYPWETPNENLYKHGAYQVLVQRDIPCFSQFGDGCVTDFRAWVHGVGSVQGNITRFHSFYLEARVCDEDQPDACGIIRTGGWQGPSSLSVDTFPRLLDERSCVDENGDRYDWCPARWWGGNLNPHQNKNFLAYYNVGQPSFTTWYTGQASNIAGVVIEIADSWNTTNPGPGGSNDTREELLAASEPLPGNSTRYQLHIIPIGFNGRLRQFFGTEAGRINFEGYTDRYGFPIEDGSCTEPGLDCVPLHLEGVPAGVQQFQYRDADSYYENDVCFGPDGVGLYIPPEYGPPFTCGNNNNNPNLSGWFEFPIVPAD